MGPPIPLQGQISFEFTSDYIKVRRQNSKIYVSIYGTNIAENRDKLSKSARERLTASNAINGRHLETEEQFRNHNLSVDRLTYREHT